MMKNTFLKTFLTTSLFILSGYVQASEDIFKSESILPLQLDAPFAKMIKDAKKLGAGSEAAFAQYPTVLSYQNAQGQWMKLPGKVAARGNTSIAECDFIKLELELEETEALKSSPFAADRKFKIGTHCGDSKPGKVYSFTDLGRVKSDLATHTEAFLYRLASALGTVAPQARYAQITYSDNAAKTSITRKAFLLETHGRVAKRIDSTKLEASAEMENYDLDPKLIPKSHIASVYFFENLIGNTDYQFPVVALDGSYMRGVGQSGASAYWNVKIFQSKKDPTKFTVAPYDFDLATPVTMMPFGFSSDVVDLFNRFVPLNNDSARGSWQSLQKLRAFFNMETLLANQKDLMNKKNIVYAQLNQAPLTEESKKSLKRQFDGFYEALNHLVDVPLLTNAHAWMNDDLNSDESQCLVRFIPPMPGKIIGQAQNGLMKVEVLDVHSLLMDISTWEFCKNPGYVSKEARLSTIVPEAPPESPEQP